MIHRAKIGLNVCLKMNVFNFVRVSPDLSFHAAFQRHPHMHVHASLTSTLLYKYATLSSFLFPFTHARTHIKTLLLVRQKDFILRRKFRVEMQKKGLSI